MDTVAVVGMSWEGRRPTSLDWTARRPSPLDWGTRGPSLLGDRAAQRPSAIAERLAAGITAAFVSRCASEGVALVDVARLGAVDPAALDAAGRVELIEASERHRAQVDGLQQRALAMVIDSTEALGLDGDAARHEVGAALRLSPGTAYDRTKVAAVLVRRLPATLRELQAGRICYLQAKLVADAVHALPADTSREVVADIEARVLKAAADQTVAQTRRTVTRAIIAADPAGAQQRAKKAKAGRAIRRHQLPDAMMGWWLTLPAAAESALWATLTATARATQTELRNGAGTDPGIDALRVDSLIDAVLDAARAAGDTRLDLARTTSTVPPDQQHTSPARDSETQTDNTTEAGTGTGTGTRTGTGTGTGTGTETGGSTGFQVSCGTAPPTSRPLPRCRCGGAQSAAVVIDLPTLLGLANNPGELPGYGPIPPTMARQLAADCDWTRWTIDPGTRRLLDRGARTYRPSDRMRRHIAAAHRHCTFPGCSRPAEQCDTDHRLTYRSGGRTIVINLGPLCRQHHNAKTHGRWRLHYNPDTATTTWTSPLGHTYTTGADPPLP